MLIGHIATSWGATIADSAHAVSQMSLATKVGFTTKAILAQAAAWAATPVGIFTIAAAGAYTLYKVIDAVNVSFDESVEKLRDITSELEAQQREYDALAAKVTDGTITSAEEDRLRILKLQTAELKIQAREEANRASKKYFNTETIDNEKAPIYVGEIPVYETLTIYDLNQKLIDSFGKLNPESKDYAENLEKIASKAGSAVDSISSFIDSADNLTDAEKEQYEALKLIIDAYLELTGVEVEAEDSVENMSSALDTLIDKLDEAQGSINALAGAMKDFNEDGELTYSSISNIAKKFSEVDDIDGYIDRLSAANLTASEFQTVMDELAVAIVQQQIASGALTEATANMNIKMLEEAGLANAAEIVHWALANAQIEAANAAYAAAGGFNAAGNEAEFAGNAADGAKGAIVGVGNTSISTAGIVGQFNNISTAAINAANNVQTLKSVLANQVVGALGGKTSSGPSSDGLKSPGNPMGVKIPTSQLPKLPSLNWSGVGGGSKGGGGGGGGKTVEEYIADVDKLYKATKRLEDIKYEIERLEVKSSITDDQQEQIENLNKIVLLYKEQQKALAEIGELRRADIRENIKELEANGFEIEYDATSNNLLIKNLENINKIVGKNKEETNELRKKYEDLISETEKLNDANRDASKEWWNLEQKLRNISKEYSDIISSVKDVYKSTIDAIQKVIDKEKEVLELQKEGFEKQQSDLETSVNTVVSFIDKQIEALQKENDELDRQIEAQKKLEEIERAKTQRAHRIYREGIGIDWDINQDAVNKAQQDYDDYKRKKDLEDKVKALEDYKKLWQDVVDGYQRGVDEQITADILGANWQKDILAQKTTNIQEYANRYNHVSNQLNEKTFGSVAYQIKQLDELSKQWGNAYDEIEDAVSDHKINLDVLKDFEKGNYNERLTLLKGYVSEAVNEINKLKAAQAAAEAAAGIGGMYQVQSDGNAQAGLKVGDKVNTAGGVYQIVSPGTPGANYNQNSGYWSVKAYSDGGVADFTGMAMLHGGSAAELILNNSDTGKLYEYIHSTPSILQDMIGRVAAGKLISVDSKITPNASQSVSVDINNMHLHGVQDTDGLANAIDRELAGALKQRLFKNK